MTASTLGCCGLDCEDCSVFIATTSNDDKLRQKTAEDWSKLYAEYVGKDGLKPKDMNCRGCRSGSSIFIGCLNCQIRKCCSEKKFMTCASCTQYKTCDMLKGFFTVPSHQSAKDKLDKIWMGSMKEKS